MSGGLSPPRNVATPPRTKCTGCAVPSIVSPLDPRTINVPETELYPYLRLQQLGFVVLKYMVFRTWLP